MSLQSPSANLLECMFKVGSRLLLTDINGSIFELKSNQFKAIIADTKLDISSLLPSGKNDLLITTYKNGIYFLRGNALVKSNKDESPLKNNRIYRACTYGNYYVLASNRAGIYFLDSSGRIVNNISIKGGLQNNNVLSLFKDRNNNVWLGLDNGIDLVRLNYPFGYLLPDGLLKGTGYTMTEFNNYYYFGTNNGLYCRAKYNNNSDAFQLVSNTEGQVWNTQVINSKLFVCHHEGLFEVNGLIANKISDTRGCWKIIKDEKNR